MMKRYQYFSMIVFAVIVCGSLSAQDCPEHCEYFIPGTLTPDCDQGNCEILEISASCPFNAFEFTLYNKWAEVIFQSTDPNMKFDSTGHDEGTYTWILKGEFCNEQAVDNRGQMHLIR